MFFTPYMPLLFAFVPVPYAYMCTFMGIKGIGSDIIEISRIRNSIARYQHHFLDKIFTSHEQSYCLSYRDPIPRFAGRFAGKESIAKALGVGIGQKLPWLSIEILNNPDGKPHVIFPANIREAFHDPVMLITISHCREYATATAMWTVD